MNGQEFEYDIQKRARAGSTATLRAAICIYIIYLGWSVLKGVLDGSSSMPAWAGWLAAIVFTGAGIAFGVYTWRTYVREKEEARFPVAENPEGETEEAEQ